MPDRTLKTLPILAMWVLAVPGMMAEGEATTYHLVLDDDHLAYDATPAAPRPTPVRFVKRQTYELMMPPQPARPQAAADGWLTAADQPLTAFLANEQPPSIIRQPFYAAEYGLGAATAAATSHAGTGASPNQQPGVLCEIVESVSW